LSDSHALVDFIVLENNASPQRGKEGTREDDDDDDVAVRQDMETSSTHATRALRASSKRACLRFGSTAASTFELRPPPSWSGGGVGKKMGCPSFFLE